MKNVPAKDKKDLSGTHFGEDGKARPVDSRIPLVHHDEKEVSMDDVLNSVKLLVEKLTAKKDEEKKQEQQKKEVNRIKNFRLVVKKSFIHFLTKLITPGSLI